MAFRMIDLIIHLISDIMEDFEIFAGVFGLICLCVGFIFALLNIILFFKVWGMTNDVAKMEKTLTQIADDIRRK